MVRDGIPAGRWVAGAECSGELCQVASIHILRLAQEGSAATTITRDCSDSLTRGSSRRTIPGLLSRVGCVNSAMTHLLIQGDAGPRSPILARHVTAPATRNTYPPISGSKGVDEPEREVAGVDCSWYDQTYSWRYFRWPRFPQSFRCRIG